MNDDTKRATNDDPTTEELQADLHRIKTAMGLQEAYPYWSRWWLIEGVGVGILFPLIQLFARGDVPWVWFLLLGGGVFLAHQLALSRVIKRYDRPATGVPSWMNWQYIALAGIGALVLGLRPVGDALSASGELSFAAVGGGAMFGVAYLFMGQLLEAHRIRKQDRYAFYAGGVWLLLLAAVLPNIPAIHGWVFTALGLGLAGHCIASYLYISHT